MSIRKEPFKSSKLEKVDTATHEEIIVGDFVRLASGSPMGVVKDRIGDDAIVTFLLDEPFDVTLHWACWRQAASHDI